MIGWSILGILHLLILTYQDIKNKRLVDDRHNWFMMGATIMLFSLYDTNIWIILPVIIITSILISYISSKKLLGSADIKTIIWSFTGFAIINIWILVNYALLILILICLYYLLAFIMKKIFKAGYIPNLPGYPVFFIAFTLISILLI